MTDHHPGYGSYSKIWKEAQRVVTDVAMNMAEDSDADNLGIVVAAVMASAACIALMMIDDKARREQNKRHMIAYINSNMEGL